MLQKIDFAQVFKSYNGRSGCACGCNGDYSLPRHVSIADANKDIGYDGYDDSDVSDRRVKLCLKKINDAIDYYGPMSIKTDTAGIGVGYEYRKGDTWFFYCDHFVALDINGRANTIYYNKGN